MLASELHLKSQLDSSRTLFSMSSLSARIAPQAPRAGANLQWVMALSGWKRREHFLYALRICVHEEDNSLRTGVMGAPFAAGDTSVHHLKQVLARTMWSWYIGKEK